MRIPKRIAIALSGLAFAGSTALTLGAALPASAQTAPTTAKATSSHVVTQWGWGWDDDWGWGGGWDDWGWGGGWDWGC